MNYKNKHLEMIKKEDESKFDDCRKTDIEEMEKYINKNLSKLRIHQLLRQRHLIDLSWDFDALALYRSAIWDVKSIYPRIETGYVFTRDMEEDLINEFINLIFTQGSSILKVKFYNPKYLIFQHLPVN